MSIRYLGEWLLFLSLLGGVTSVAATETRDPALLYHNYCSVCHGDRGDGNSHARTSLDPPPRDFTRTDVAVTLGRERMIAVVRDGIPGTAMAGWKTQLSEAEIEAVVDYIRTRFMPPLASSEAGRGRRIYAESCSVCHGDRGQGAVWAQESLNPSPRDFTSEAARRELTRERMITSVTYGRPGTAMAAFGRQLSTQDIEAVVDYIRAAFMEPVMAAGISGTHAGGMPPNSGKGAPPVPDSGNAGRAATGIDMQAPMPEGLKGDARRGMELYMLNCTACHGAQGDGDGPRAYFIMPRPRNFLLPASRRSLNRPALFRGIARGKLGTEMPAWEKVLTRQQIADIAEFVFQRFILQEEDNP